MQAYSAEQMTYTDNANPLYQSRQLSASQAAIGRRIAGTTAGTTDVKLTFSAYEFFIFNLLHGAIWNTYKQEVVKPLHHMTVSPNMKHLKLCYHMPKRSPVPYSGVWTTASYSAK
jgi:hypothetical protein